MNVFFKYILSCCYYAALSLAILFPSPVIVPLDDPTSVWPELAIIREDLDLSEDNACECAENDLIFK